MVCPADAIAEVPAPDYALSREDLVVSRGTDVASELGVEVDQAILDESVYIIQGGVDITGNS